MREDVRVRKTEGSFCDAPSGRNVVSEGADEQPQLALPEPGKVAIAELPASKSSTGSASALEI